MIRLCFLFNHDQAHQLAHSLPIALALANGNEADITIAVTNSLLEEEVRRLAKGRIASERIVHLRPRSWVSRIGTKLLDGMVPTHKLLIYRDYLDFFGSFDGLVVTEKTSLLLKSHYGLDSLKIIHTRHGAGDRAIGFDAKSSQFDLSLVAGPKIARRLMSEAGVRSEAIRITGYPKFDMFGQHRPALPLVHDGRPTVLYNPHPSPHLSSWYDMGPAIMEAFYRSSRFNLIFAPHVMLFERPLTITIDRLSLAWARRPDPRYGDAPHMLIDLGSAASNDMSYTNGADLYLGDVSSQVYEFLYHPRPCVFLNAHGVNWTGDPNYLHWQAGPVIDDVTDIIAICEHAMETHASYLPAQRALIDDTFSMTGETASSRAAAAIVAFMSLAEVGR